MPRAISMHSSYFPLWNRSRAISVWMPASASRTAAMPAGSSRLVLVGDFQRFVVGVAGLLPLRVGRGGVAQRHGLVERGDVEVRLARRLQHVAPQENRFMLIRAADLGHFRRACRSVSEMRFGFLRAGGVFGQRERGLGQFQGDGLDSRRSAASGGSIAARTSPPRGTAAVSAWRGSAGGNTPPGRKAAPSRSPAPSRRDRRRWPAPRRRCPAPVAGRPTPPPSCRARDGLSDRRRSVRRRRRGSAEKYRQRLWRPSSAPPRGPRSWDRDRSAAR